MSAITINIPEERLRRLQELAARLGVTPEELAGAGVEELLAASDEKFDEAARYVLEKNAELYRRLA
jgi:predicted transcriptional regulator